MTWFLGVCVAIQLVCAAGVVWAAVGTRRYARQAEASRVKADGYARIAAEEHRKVVELVAARRAREDAAGEVGSAT